MNLRLSFPLVRVVVVTALVSPAQQPSPGEIDSSLSTRTANVLVPALVRNASGKLVYSLQADDFVLTDDGVRQKLSLLEDTGTEPLALVIVIEVGGAGSRQFQKYDRLVPPLAPMLPSIVGNVHPRVAIITFDSRPKLAESFTSDLAQVYRPESVEAGLELR